MSTRDRMALAEEQVSGLIDLVMAGEDAHELVSAVHEEIEEGYGGGPFPIGSRVTINTTWSGKTIEGSDVTVTKGDKVSVVQPNLGEKGQDRMVLLKDGKTRVVVPYEILGESIDEQGELSTGPSGHKVPPAKGKLGGAIHGKAQGDSPTPQQRQPPKVTGDRKPSSHPSTFQGKGKPKQAPTAQVAGQMAPATISGKTVEEIQGDVVQALDELMDESGDNNALYRQASELQRTLVAEADPVMYMIMHEAIFGEDNFTVDVLQTVASLMVEKKKCNGKNKKNGDDYNGDDDDDMDESLNETDIHEIFDAMDKMKKKKKDNPMKGY